MPQITAALVIKNGASTPVDKTFSPVRVAPERSIFADRTSGMSLGFPTITVKSSAADTKRQTNRVDVDVDLPVVIGDAVTGYKVGHTLRFRGYFVLPEAASAEQRSDLLAFAANSLGHATVRATIKDLDAMY